MVIELDLELDHDPQKALKKAKELDIECPAERRVAVYLLYEFYGSILCNCGRGLDIEEIHSYHPRKQWRKIQTRITLLDGLAKPDGDSELNEFKKLPYIVHGEMNNVRHNFAETTEEVAVGKLRENAEDWRAWIEKETENHLEHQKDANSQDLIGNMILQILEEIWFPPHHEDDDVFEDKIESISAKKDEIRDQLENALEPDDKVTPELVYLLEDTRELQVEFKEYNRQRMENERALSQTYTDEFRERR